MEFRTVKNDRGPVVRTSEMSTNQEIPEGWAIREYSRYEISVLVGCEIDEVPRDGDGGPGWYAIPEGEDWEGPYETFEQALARAVHLAG